MLVEILTPKGGFFVRIVKHSDAVSDKQAGKILGYLPIFTGK